MKVTLILLLVLMTSISYSQKPPHDFKIRTITAGITLTNLSDTSSINKAVSFLKSAREHFTKAGYEVQTLRISTQHFYSYLDGKSYDEALPFLVAIDQITQKEGIGIAIGNLLPSNQYDPKIADWVTRLVNQTETINFSLPISSTPGGVFPNSIKASAEIAQMISKTTKGGEGNFRFTASANCPSGIPFFPAAYHEGANSFAIGIEYPNVLTAVFSRSTWDNARENLTLELEKQFKPIQELGISLSKKTQWKYDGLDTSPAPGLEASIGTAIETLTKQPFGGPSTLRACALITDVIKSLDLITCGYSGLMLPVIEDKTLAQRAMENRYTQQEILLFSSVSGTGLDVIPIPGNTSLETLESIYGDVAALSLKYTNKALSARLFLIPDKVAGDTVTFENAYLTTCIVMKAE